MEFESLMHERLSIRKYLDKQVPRETIEKILSLAQLTPSWCNTQPWQVIVTGGEHTSQLREALWDHVQSGNFPKTDFPFPAKYVDPYKGRRKECGYQLYDSIGIPKEDRMAGMQQTMQNFRFFDAPHALFIFLDDHFGFYGGVDCGLYVNSVLLAAKNEGVDAVAQAALASYPDFIRQHFQLPDNLKLVCGISFGYADMEHAINQYRTPRAPLEESIRYYL